MPIDHRTLPQRPPDLSPQGRGSATVSPTCAGVWRANARERAHPSARLDDLLPQNWKPPETTPQ
jgi:hypothetical protein